MTVYGSIPGVRIETNTAGVSGVTIGRESILTFIGVGASSATAPTNEVVQLTGREQVVDEFGESSDILAAYDLARANGANTDFINAVRVSTESTVETTSDVTNELSNIPVDDKSRIDVSDTQGSEDPELVFDFDSPPTVPEEPETVRLNPATGEFEAEVTNPDSIEFDYEYPVWNDGIIASSDALREGQFGVTCLLGYDSEAVTTLDGELTSMREDELKMAVGMAAVEPNQDLGNELPGYDTANISSVTTSDVMFEIAGAVDSSATPDQGGFTTSALGAVAGLFAGNPNTDPVYDTTLTGLTGLAQRFSRTDVSNLRSEYVIPIRESNSIRVADNHSTYDQEKDGGWERDFFHRRIVDLATITSYRIARRQIGGVLDVDTVEDVTDALSVELSELAADGLLQPGGQSVRAYREDARTIGVELTITPFGVAKGADVSLNVTA